jgi:hypothetical protein
VSDEWYCTVWGWRQVYWGIEHAEEGWTFGSRRLSIEPMTELEAPYRVGKGIRLRLGHRAFHLGRCRLAERPPGRELHEVSIDEISQNYRGSYGIHQEKGP